MAASDTKTYQPSCFGIRPFGVRGVRLFERCWFIRLMACELSHTHWPSVLLRLQSPVLLLRCAQASVASSLAGCSRAETRPFTYLSELHCMSARKEHEVRHAHDGRAAISAAALRFVTEDMRL